MRARAVRIRLRAGMLSVVTPLLIGGVQPASDGLFEHWCWSGAFVYPIGDPYHMMSPRPYGGAPPYNLIRGFSEEPGERRHEGADFSNGRGGDVVRAAGHGLVVLADQRDTVANFGVHIVLAHRLPGGTLAYSIYGHLRPGSVRVREGERVWLGQPIARVGRSGKSTGDHLHFEVRRPEDPGDPWGNARAVDPLIFLAAWIPGHRADTSRAGRYLEWAEEAALVGPRDEGGQPLSRAAWWEMLAHAARHPVRGLSARPDSLRLELIDCSVLPLRAQSRADERVRWREVVRDVRRLRDLGVRVPPPPVPTAIHRAECLRVFGGPRPQERLKTIARATVPVARADACLLLADLAAPADSAYRVTPDSLRGPFHRRPGGRPAARHASTGAPAHAPAATTRSAAY